MTKFMVLYTAPISAEEQMQQASPEQAKESMKPWMDWAEKCGEGMVSMGSPLGNGKVMTPKGATESAKNIVGYSVLQAENMTEALKMLEGHPHLGWNDACGIEVYEELPLPGMEG